MWNVDCIIKLCTYIIYTYDNIMIYDSIFDQILHFWIALEKYFIHFFIPLLNFIIRQASNSFISQYK